jgi:nucleoside-diphosphate-sugar epimerase
MKVLVTGHDGYIGSVMMPMLQKAGHTVVGLDTYYYGECKFGEPESHFPFIKKDIRQVEAADLDGFDAVIHLAALSNDPLGNLNSDLTGEINHRASVRLARLSKEAGVGRFLFSSSCSLYGLAGDGFLTEEAPFNPVTAYGWSKVWVEQELTQLADEEFSPTYLRNATAYGVSPRLRGDVVVNNLVGHAFTTGEILIMSDGTPWRPLVHVEDICMAFIRVLEAPRDLVHDQAFNVGNRRENYQVRDLAEMVREVVPGSAVKYAPGGSPDTRCYRVDCTKLTTVFPDLEPRWTVRDGVKQLYAAYVRHGLTAGEFLGSKYQRIKQIQKLQAEGRLDANLHWIEQNARSGGEDVAVYTTNHR